MSYNEKFYIDCLGAKVFIDTDIQLKKFFYKNKDFIEFPGIKILDFKENIEDVNNTFVYRNSNNRNILCNENSIIVNYPYEELTDKNIAYLSKYLIEKQFGEMGMATCHSACVEKDGKAILFLGEAGAGKTSVALNLCLNEGYSLISNDKTLIGLKNGKLQAFDGTKYLRLRYKSVKENIPQFIKLFENEDVEGWTQKIQVKASEIGIKECYQMTEISDVIFLHVDNREEKLKITDGDTYRNNFILYNNLTENIRACSSTFMDKKGHPVGYIPSYDSPEIFRKRTQIIEYINSMKNYKYVSGNLQEILKNLVQDIKE